MSADNGNGRTTARLFARTSWRATKGSVDVHTKRSGAAADDRTATFRFEVDDTGIGMAPEQLVRICDAITQADDSITLRYGEFGLGPSIAQRLAN